MKPSCKFGIATALLALASVPASAAEIAVLRNGFSIHAQRHEARDNMTRLYMTGTTDSYVDVPTADIASFEEEEPGPLPPPSSSAPAPAPAKNLDAMVSLDAVVSAASNRNNINPDLIYSVIRAESAFNPTAVSPKGAQGLMQLMPQTAARLGVRNAMDPTANVEGGTRYLRDLLTLYHNNLIKALAAYNAGPERVEQYHGVPPYRETYDYVARVIRNFNRTKFAQQPPQPDPVSNRGAKQNSKATTPRRSKVARPVTARGASSAGAGS